MFGKKLAIEPHADARHRFGESVQVALSDTIANREMPVHETRRLEHTSMRHHHVRIGNDLGLPTSDDLVRVKIEILTPEGPIMEQEPQTELCDGEVIEIDVPRMGSLRDRLAFFIQSAEISEREIVTTNNSEWHIAPLCIAVVWKRTIEHAAHQTLV